MVWLMPLQTGNKRREPREGKRKEEMREGDGGNETSKERGRGWRERETDNAPNTGGTIVQRYELRIGDRNPYPGVSHFVLWELGT